jgi:C-terminal processing protease CtpA/Prc
MITLSASAADLTPPTGGTSTIESYRYMRQQRDLVQKLLQPGASKKDAEHAASQLEELLRYLDTPPLAERAAGYFNLYAEHVNLLITLAKAYMRLDRKDDALTALERTTSYIWSGFFDKAVEQDNDLSPLLREPRYMAIRGVWATPDRVYGKGGVATPYQPVLTIEEKIAGLSSFWSEVREHFVWFDHVPDLDWNKTYLAYLSKVSATRSTREYYDVMRQLAALLQDGHTNVYPPKELRDEVYSRPGLSTALLEGKVLVTHIGNDELAKRIRIGDELIAIDGEPTRSYAEQHVKPYVAASTPQDRQLRIFNYELLAGNAGKPLKLRLRGADGLEREEAVTRSGQRSLPERFVFKMLSGGVAYISIDGFENDKGLKAFERALPEIMTSKALVIDLRRNGGGNGMFGLQILSYLTKDPIPVPSSFERDTAAVRRAQGDTSIALKPVSAVVLPVKIFREKIFEGRVAVLTSAQTFSAAEDFTASFKLMKRGLVVGEPTGGSTGQPLIFPLPGGGTARICVKRDTWPDGSSFVGKGIQPDIVAAPSVASIRDGTDPVLEVAVASLGSSHKTQ